MSSKAGEYSRFVHEFGQQENNMNERISSAMASFCTAMPMEEAMRLVRDAGFDALDFPLSTYSRTPDAPMLRDDWRAWCRHVREASEKLGLPITQAHAPWSQDIPENFHYEAPWELFEHVIEASRILGCDNLIFHPVRQFKRVDSLAMRERIHEWNVRWFTDLLPVAREYGVTLHPENTFDSHHVQLSGDLPYPYTTADDMLRLVCDLSDPHVRLCLDTGHANIAGQDIPAMIRAFGNALGTVHLNDNYGKIAPIFEDLHLFPGYGRIAWDEVFSALREVGFRGVLNIEPISELKRMPQEVRRIQLRAAADTLRALARAF